MSRVSLPLSRSPSLSHAFSLSLSTPTRLHPHDDSASAEPVLPRIEQALCRSWLISSTTPPSSRAKAPSRCPRPFSPAAGAC
eukprot:811298-Rhodomonas_salina.1